MRWAVLALVLALVGRCGGVRDATSVDLAAFGGRVEVCAADTCGCRPGFSGSPCAECPVGSFKSQAHLSSIWCIQPGAELGPDGVPEGREKELGVGDALVARAAVHMHVERARGAGAQGNGRARD